MKCKICHKTFRHLGSHLWHGHHVLSRDYKEEYGLPYNMSLISEDIKEKQSKKSSTFEKNFKNSKKSSTFEKNFKNSKKYQFKKGRSGIRRISEHERVTILARINDVNKNRKPEPCPVCKMIFDNVNSHLANKHKLLRI